MATPEDIDAQVEAAYDPSQTEYPRFGYGYENELMRYDAPTARPVAYDPLGNRWYYGGTGSIMGMSVTTREAVVAAHPDIDPDGMPDA